MATIPVMLVVALFVFSLLYLAPGDPAAIIAGDQATPADVDRIRASLGLDRPFVVRFGEWLWQVIHGDLGTSIFTNLPVSHMIAQRIEPTLSLMLLTITFSIVFAIPLGVLAAWRHGSWIDRGVMMLAVFGFSVPVFVIGYLLAYIFALQLDWLPVQGFTSISQGVWPFLRNMILPTVALGLVYVALLARITRATMLEVLSQDYVRTAKAKGVGQRGAHRHRAGHRRRAVDRRRGDHRERLRHPRSRPSHGRCDPAARLSGDPGRRPAVQLRLCPGQSGRRPALYPVRSEDPLLMTGTGAGHDEGTRLPS
jgi:ABC-type dipeptide/oligopeptide/nickel transport system permease component